MKKLFAFLLLNCIIFFAYAETDVNFEEGKDYFAYKNPVGNTASDKITIQFYFTYECRLCLETSDMLDRYQREHSKEVEIKKYPAANAKSRLSASIYHLFNILERPELSDLLLFDSAVTNKARSFSQSDVLSKWLRKQHINLENFVQLLDSAEVKEKTDESVILTKKYQVSQVPVVVIDDRYFLTMNTLYNDDYSVAVLDFLLKKRLKERQQQINKS